MNDFNGKVAVITGAASGIGRGLAERCLREGMHVVLADIEEPALRQTESELRKAGGTVLAVRTDVSKAAGIEALARRTMDTFGAVHLLVNNAGVAAGGALWESTPEDWAWVMDVNLWGVIHGIRTFVPLMLAQGTEGHVVNTSSIAGVMPYHPSAPYQTTKAAVVALTFDAIREERLFIFTHAAYMGLARQRMEAMLSGEAMSGELFVQEPPTEMTMPSTSGLPANETNAAH